MKPLTYLLIDFENVKPSATEVAQIRGGEFRLWIFRGPHQNKFDADMVEAWQPLGDHVKFIQSAKSGKNALDFHIAFCLGMVHRENVAAQRPARYIVVSKDSGFDALFEYARTEACLAMRAATISDALSTPASMGPIPPRTPSLRAKSRKTPAIAAGVPKPPEPPVGESTAEPSAITAKAATTTVAKRTTLNADDVEKVATNLREHPKNRPTKRTTLERHAANILGKDVAEEVAHAVVDRLVSDKLVTIENNKIEYKLSQSTF